MIRNTSSGSGEVTVTTSWLANDAQGQPTILESLSLKVTVVVYSTNCELVAPLLCSAQDPCQIYAKMEYTSTVQVDNATITPLGGGTITLGNGTGTPPSYPPVSNFRFIWQREDSLPCNDTSQEGHENTAFATVTFMICAGINCATVPMEFGCTACKKNTSVGD